MQMSAVTLAVVKKINNYHAFVKLTMETWRLGLLLTAALLATASFAEGKRRPFRSIKAPKGEREIAGGPQPDQIDFKML